MTDEEKTEEYVNGAVMYGLAEGRKESEKLLDKLNLQNQRLNELKNENDYLRNDFIYIIQDKTKRALLKENAELNRDKTELVNSVTELKTKVTELEKQLKNNPYVQILQNEKAEIAEDFAKQIEKMKCCGNCKHEQDSNTDYYCEDCKRFANETDIEKWESAE